MNRPNARSLLVCHDVLFGMKMSTSEEEDYVKRLLVELADASRTVTIASSTGDRITGKGTLSIWTKEAVITSSHSGHNRPIWTAQRFNAGLRNSVVSIQITTTHFS
jgi:hypothetical protein